MGDASIKIDISTANRFISGLSKSLQALCHGCMDFDNGIEIIGYINISIDQANRVDYVLNEKVQKGEVNSMTFVSNSFLAQKEQPKVMKDKSCSPIPEINHSIPEPSHTPGHFAFPSSRNRHNRQRSATHLPPAHYSNHNVKKRSHPQAVPSASWGSSYDKYSRSDMNSSMAQYTNNFQQKESVSSHSSDNNASSQLDIKQEVQNENNETSESSVTAENASVKLEPGSSSGENAEDNFSEDVNKSEPMVPGSDVYDDASTTEQNTDDFSGLVDNDTNTADSNNSFHPDTSSGMACQSEWTDADNTQFDGNGGASKSSSGIEGVMDGEQFDVIEIDDEDEDVQGLWDNQSLSANRKEGSATHTNSYFHQSPSHLRSQAVASSESMKCSFCSYESYLVSDFKRHVSNNHGDTMPFTCTLCGKGFLSNRGLQLHTQAHDGRKFVCPICDFKFIHKHHLKSHMRNIHKLCQCRVCFQNFPIGEEFDKHMVYCGP